MPTPPLPIVRVFYSGRGASGWYYGFGRPTPTNEPVGPFDTQIAAGKAARAKLIEMADAVIAATEPPTQRFNVHLYTPYRVKFTDIAAPDHAAAVRIALGMDHAEATEIMAAEGLAIDALVDVVGDGEFAESRTFDIVAGEPVLTPTGDPPVVVRQGRSLAAPLTNRDLAAVLAGLRLYEAFGGQQQLARIEEAVRVTGDTFSFGLPVEMLRDIADIATCGGDFLALPVAEVDALCERLNVGPTVPTTTGPAGGRAASPAPNPAIDPQKETP